jgi:hypothetical protein
VANLTVRVIGLYIEIKKLSILFLPFLLPFEKKFAAKKDA